ncbi:recombinase family protein [Intestinibacter bartlettii]|uniref:recombinase family protein n=1 Tax=Intestinibacter bartlettii TaxID=261299 RepID=UPI00242A6C0D|nr:recombinase family protein [Intestinibacter bartlettii]
MSKTYGYCRCSMNEDKQDIQRQVRELIELGATKETIYKEYINGSSDDKVELNKLLAVINEGDTIVATEVSRITRSTKQLCEIIELIKDKKLKLIIKDSITVDCTNGTLDAMTKAFLQMSGVFAELERDIISQRVKSGMANARAKGKQIGRAKTSMEEVLSNKKFMESYELYKKGSINKSQIARLTGMSRPTVIKYVKLLEE